MSPKRGASGFSGVVLIDKPAGMTSHDVVDVVRKAFGEGRVGHAGTLDPDATGLLVVCVGPATRLVHYLTADEKTYRARIVFGSATDTDDAAGSIIQTCPVPDEVGDPFFAASFVRSLVGTHEQVPPAFSAIKRDGKVAYKQARKGEALELEPRKITIEAATLQGVVIAAEGALSGLAWDIELSVSKGTYIRALARDIGKALGTAAHLESLRRISCGSYTLKEACTLEDLVAADDPARLFADPVVSLAMPAVTITPDEARELMQGKTLKLSYPQLPASDGDLVAFLAENKLLSIHQREGAGFIPKTIIAGGVVCPHDS